MCVPITKQMSSSNEFYGASCLDLVTSGDIKNYFPATGIDFYLLVNNDQSLFDQELSAISERKVDMLNSELATGIHYHHEFINWKEN